ncbi:MarR family transcriptional regulator [Kineosporia sp. J2-2]|uniref:MarR family transcriptional regulator n=1 Tax=Kineosporia corallincola TaxID=2835133 RepID=A0ABS5TL87_9ACTN|nr:MarR family transcriptional regulator [Kineosporia corallincola]MBT0771608.1 MarR family transcriptional regulator [Kineosporia corallincola]
MGRPQTGNEVVDAVLGAAHRVRRSMDTGLRASGLSLPTYKLLRELSRGERSMRELSDVLRVTPRTVTDMVDGLESRGQVERRPHPTDRRVTRVHLTEVGAKDLEGIGEQAEAVRDRAIAGLSAAEKATLVSLLDRIAAS